MTSPHLSTLTLHQHRLGELPPGEVDAVAAHLDTCRSCAMRLEALVAEDQAFQAEPLPAWLAEVQAEPVAAPPPRPEPAHDAPSPGQWLVFLRRVAPAAALMAAALAAFLLVGQPFGPEVPLDDGIRTRGEAPVMEVWVAGEMGPRPLREGEALRAGDTVQLLFDPRGATLVGLAGRDGTGAVEVYGVLEPGDDGLQPAPFGLTLDDAPGPQTFFVVGGGPDLTEGMVKEALRGSVEGVDVSSVVIDKE